MIPEPIFDSPHPSAPPLPTGEELTGEARAVSRATGLSDPPSRQFSDPSQDCTTAGIFGGVTTYADSSEVMSIQDAPTYRPTEEQFEDPIKFIESIREVELFLYKTIGHIIDNVMTIVSLLQLT